MIVSVSIISCSSSRIRMSGAWRDSHAQQKYRQQSRSENKATQHVSHQVSIEVAKHVDSHISGPTARANQKAVNASSNFYMKDSSTNLSTDKRLDSGIISKSESGERLTVAETQRARIQATEIQSNPGYTDAFKGQARDMYRGMASSDGKVLWDDRKNVK